MVNRLNNKNNDIINEIKKEFKRHTEILVEHMDDKIALIVEQYQNFDKRFDKIEERLENVEEILQQHSIILVGHSKILNEHANILKEMQKQISEIRFDLKQKVDYKEIQHLQKRVFTLEQKILQLSRAK